LLAPGHLIGTSAKKVTRSYTNMRKMSSKN